MILKSIARHPWIPAVLLFASAMAFLVFRMLAKTGGILVYPIDDPYIHLTLARNLAETGIWGISPGEFSNSSSSPLWTLLLALLIKIGLPATILPLLLNELAGLTIIAVLCRLALRQGLSPAGAIALSVAAVLFVPLPLVAVCGMEHLVHIGTLLGMIYWGLSGNERRDTLLMAVCAFAAAGLRYETLFPAFVLGLILLRERRIGRALILGAASLLPVVLFALYSTAHGGFPFPNGMMIKGNLPGLDLQSLILFAARFIKNIMSAPHLVGLMAVGALMGGSPGKWLQVFIGGSILHLLFAQVGWFYRYEAALMVIGFAAVAFSLPSWFARFSDQTLRPLLRFGIPAIALILSLGLSYRTVDGTLGTPHASQDIFRQQVMVGKFLGFFCPGTPVVLSDIGAASYYGRVRVLDVLGLGTDRIARERRQGTFTSEGLSRLVRDKGAVCAVVYDHVFFKQELYRFSIPFFARFPFLEGLKPYFTKQGPGRVPLGWTKVAEWENPDNVVCDSGVVAFYAFYPEGVEALAAGLTLFAKKGANGARFSTQTR